MDTFRGYAATPYVISANKQDHEDAWHPDDLRIALKIDHDIKVLPCVANDRETVKAVLLELLYSILETMDTQSD